MTNDAPIRIFVKPFHNGAVGECWHDATTEPAKPWEFNEYIRADIAKAKQNAAVAAERDVCAQVCHEYSKDHGTGAFDRHSAECERRIRARANTDALEAYRKKVRAEALRERDDAFAALDSVVTQYDHMCDQGNSCDLQPLEDAIEECRTILDKKEGDDD